MDALRRAQEALTKDDIVEKTTKSLSLVPLAQLDKDEHRQQIDDTFSKLLGLPSLSPIHLAREPGLTAREINPRQVN